MIHNRPHPKLWFKVVDPLGRAVDGKMEQWILPEGKSNGSWNGFQFLSPQGSMPQDYDVGLNQKAISLIANPKTLYSQFKGSKIYVAEYQGEPIKTEPGLIWVQRARLIREATNLDLKPIGIYRAFQQVF